MRHIPEEVLSLNKLQFPRGTSQYTHVADKIVFIVYFRENCSHDRLVITVKARSSGSQVISIQAHISNPCLSNVLSFKSTDKFYFFVVCTVVFRTMECLS
jgi:hypothetical protein